jgi:5-methyltetrahydrofolate--homocysteine methyltransferase
MADLLAALRSGHVLLMDGAMGTELQRRGLKPGENPSTWVELHPGKVRAVHRAYLAAGAEVLLTNTFMAAANSYGETMRRLGRQDWHPPAPWNKACGLIGPAARFRIASHGPVLGTEIGREFDELWGLYVSDRCWNYDPHPCCHVPDAILLETCSTPRVRFALRALRRHVHQCPLLLSLTYLRDERGRLVTSSGHSPEWFAERAKRYGTDALGVNCGRDIGMDDIIEIVRRYRAVTDLPLFARPNAGTPTRKGKRWVYPTAPEAMAARLPELLEAGVSMVGGCCGTTPEHIAAFRPVVEKWNRRRRSGSKA